MIIRRCAAILVLNEQKQEEWKIIRDPSIGDIRSLRQKGAVILRCIYQKYGNEIHKTWIVDNGTPVIESIEFKGDYKNG